MIEKLKSRKFLMSFAAFLGSLGTSIAGIASNNERIIAIGTLCMMFSAAIYAACEAYVDAEAVETETTYYIEDGKESEE